MYIIAYNFNDLECFDQPLAAILKKIYINTSAKFGACFTHKNNWFDMVNYTDPLLSDTLTFTHDIPIYETR